MLSDITSSYYRFFPASHVPAMYNEHILHLCVTDGSESDILFERLNTDRRANESFAAVTDLISS